MDDLRKTSIGYSVNLVMDYGSGRQVNITGTLPLNATLEDFNAELDKLRLATNRQASLVAKRDIENTVEMGKKTVASLELMLAEIDRGFEEEIKILAQGDTKNHTLTKQQIQNIRGSAANARRMKTEEIMRAKADVEKGEAFLIKIKKEIGEE